MLPKPASTTSVAASNCGVVVSVLGSVVEISFDRHLPAIFTILREGADQQVIIEVLAQIDANRVRGIDEELFDVIARFEALSDGSLSY